MGARELEYVKPHELIIIGLDTEDGADHPLYDDRIFLPVDENLVRNISFYGIQQPVLIRREGEKMYVIDGRQRTRAAREAANRQALAGEYQLLVPVRESRGDDKRIVGIMISTNEQRQDDEVLGKALKAARMLDLCGDMDQVAVAFGRTKNTIKNWLSLAEADSAVHDALRAGEVSAQAATEISRYPRAEQRTVLERAKAEQAPGSQVTGARLAEIRVEDGQSTATKATQAIAGSSRKKSNSNHRGVKRIWLRKALKSAAAKQLTPEQRAVLEWFASGRAEDHAWYQLFRKAAEKEMSGESGDEESDNESDNESEPAQAAEADDDEFGAINWGD